MTTRHATRTDTTSGPTDPALTRLMQELRFPVMATIGTRSGMPSLSVIWFDLDPDQRRTWSC